MSIAHLDATAQAALVRRGELTPRELVEAAQARIGRHDAELGAVVRHTDDVAAATLRALPDGPFRGVPIVIKDLIADVAGTPQGAGCRILRRLAPPAPADSHLVAQLRRAGFVIVGKTNTSEFGILPTAEPLGLPPSRNPYDTTRSTGGSSGGSAAAVASGMVPIGHANDGGGSIRIPASCCGLFGLKPSRGRVSLAPRYGDLNGGLAAEHVVTRSVRDSAAVLDVLAGPVSGDPYAAPAPRRPYREEVGAPVGRLRIGFATHFPAGDGTMRDSEPECVAAVAHAARLLTALGHDVEHHDIAALRDPEWTPRFLAIWAVGVAAHLAEIERHTGAPLGDEDVEPLTLAIGTIGKGMAGHVYVSAWQWLHRKAR